MTLETQEKLQTTSKIKKEKKISLFKDVTEFEKELIDFANKFKTTIVSHSKRISDYFEMSCFNHLVKFYELNEYKLIIENLQNNQYRYKCSTSGIQSNFSNFVAQKLVKGKLVEFEIQHNLAVQSSHDKELFTTPDISVINKGKVIVVEDYYDTKRKFSYVENKNFITFCEVKNFTPFPELIFNFIGVVNELQKEIITNKTKKSTLIHISPSLMISGKPNKQTARIKKSLENRYQINIIYDLFYTGTETFSKKQFKNLQTTSNKTNA
jgi:hypothetical protein